MISAKEALQQLQSGNGRFLAEIHTHNISQTRRAELATGQAPFAVILSCADSRVPPEIIFDQGLGDLFVIRVAGNVITPAVLGSVEFAVHVLGSRLVVVLGHTECGAVKTTVDELAAPTDTLSPNLQALVDEIRPSITPLLSSNQTIDTAALLPHAVQANIHQSVTQLHQRSKIVQTLCQNDGLQLIGAEYSLETGAVTFFDTPNR